jgi:hypothetical protein
MEELAGWLAGAAHPEFVMGSRRQARHDAFSFPFLGARRSALWKRAGFRNRRRSFDNLVIN